jgi:ABC-type hemin transport system ATPase subunit/CubicO group peptidase (beta-lactamase class C family)
MIAVRGATVRAGGRALLAGVSLDLRPGEVLAVAGPNGAGKSTLLRAMTGELRLSSGEVALDGRSLAAWPPLALARRRSVVSQASSLAFPMAAEEVVALGRLPWHGTPGASRDAAAVARALDVAGITHLSRQPHATLSGGERQRVQVARALAQLDGAPRPAALLLDEPTASLDVRHAALLLRLLRRLAAEGLAVLVVLHDLNEAAFVADRVAMLAEGRLAALGPPEEVLAAGAVEAVYGIAFRTLPGGFVLPRYDAVDAGLAAGVASPPAALPARGPSQGERHAMQRRALLAVPPALALAALHARGAAAQPQPLPGAAAPPLPVVRPAEVGLNAERLGRIREVFEAEVAANRLPGAVILIARRGRLALAEAIGFRDRQAGARMEPDAVFRIYSMTKPLVSVAAMMLVEEGRIGLADPVGRYLPGMDRPQVSVARDGGGFEPVAATRPMQVYDLLRHTSGLAYGELTQNAPVRDAYARAGLFQPGVIDFDSRRMTPEEFTRGLAAAPLARQPGTTWEYSLSSDALGRVVEAASGRTLDAFLEERLFRPLGMPGSGFALPQGGAGRLAMHSGVDPANNNQPVAMIDVSRPPGNASGGAGAVATASDYLRFSQMLANGGQLDGVRILSPATVRWMISDHVAGLAQPLAPGMLLLGSPGFGFGLGFAVRLADGGALVPGLEGQFMWAGYGGTYFWVDPRADLVAVCMTAAPSVARAGYRRLLMNLTYAAIEG